MKVEREIIDQEIKEEVEKLRNTFDTIRLVEEGDFTQEKLLIPYLNGQASILSNMLQVPQITNKQRYIALRKLIALQTCMLQYVELEDEPEEEPKPEVKPEHESVELADKAMEEKQAQDQNGSPAQES